MDYDNCVMCVFERFEFRVCRNSSTITNKRYMFAISAYSRPTDMHRSAVRHRCLTISIVYTRSNVCLLAAAGADELCTGAILHTGFRGAFVLSIRLT